jgi:Proprotein convertase P-domain/Papain family cysteine protease
MRIRSLVVALAIPFAGCASGEAKNEGPTPFDDDSEVGADIINDGAPDNDSLPDDTKADQVFPAQFEVKDQSAVKSQGSRGVCSIFASTAMIENLYIKGGMPAAEANFSEQYLQWAVKHLDGAFANTGGSSSDANLRTTVQFGTIKESDWPYESFPWSIANDPECTGDEAEGLPTKCYTNGEPPAGVTTAHKFKIPSSRWINNNSIKAHITAKKVGVNVGMTFFYQGWNHRHSELPVNAEYWRQGYVTYPNAKDKEVSLAHRAGHAIHIVGWDDNLAVCTRDEAGKDVLDASGNCVMETGFWIFKNSWGTVGFGIQHPSGPGYGYLSYKYVKEFGSAVVAEIPSLETPHEICDDAGGVDEDGDGKANCADPDCMNHPACAGGNTAHTFSASPNAAIPDEGQTSSAIDVAIDGSVTDVKVTVDITHSFRGDLKVSLVKGAITKVLVNGEGGGAHDLKQTFTVTGLDGQALRGAWTLVVEDTAAQDTGTLNSWSLDVSAH